jgi:DNA-binding NarL/FixJ family response regulator
MPHRIDHVLIVDDRPFSRRLLASMCSIPDRRQVLYAADQDQTLCLLGEQKSDIVLLDWHLAKSEAANVLNAIRAAPAPDVRHTPVLMLAGQADRSLVAQLVDLKADGLVIKPCAATVLEQAMQLAVDRRHNQKMIGTDGSDDGSHGGSNGGSNTPNASKHACR